MIKRRYYRAEHTEKDAASDSSSSSSDDDDQIQPQISDNDDVTDNESDDVTDPSSLRQNPPVISSSGYESEESSGNQIDAADDTSGLIAVDEDNESESDKELLDMVTAKSTPEGLPDADNIANCVLKSKSVFKCRLCPKIVCLNEESLATHLKSKRHSRSEKLLNDGRLKRFLNSDGEEEVVSDDEDGETHAERHARILALAEADLATKKSRGRQRQRQRLKKKKEVPSEEKPSSEPKKDNRAKRRKKASSEPKKDNRAKRRKRNVD